MTSGAVAITQMVATKNIFCWYKDVLRILVTLKQQNERIRSEKYWGPSLRLALQTKHALFLLRVMAKTAPNFVMLISIHGQQGIAIGIKSCLICVVLAYNATHGWNVNSPPYRNLNQNSLKYEAVWVSIFYNPYTSMLRLNIWMEP